MAAECPFCGYRGTAYTVQMHIDEHHEFDSPLPTRQPPVRHREMQHPFNPYEPHQPTRNPPMIPKERGERFRLPPTAPAPAPKPYSTERYPPDLHPAEDFPIREKRIITKKYPVERVDEPWIQCGRQGCGMYVARDVMNQHLDMHDMYEYDAERMAEENAHRAQQRRQKRLGLSPFEPDDGGAHSAFSRQDSLLDPLGRSASKAGSLVSENTLGSNGLRQKRLSSSSQGGAGKGSGGDGGSSASKKKSGWSRSSISSKNKDKNGQRGSGKSNSGSAKSNSGKGQDGGDPNGGSGNGPPGGILNNTASNGRNGSRAGSNSGSSQRNGGGSGGGDGGGGSGRSNSGGSQRGGSGNRPNSSSSHPSSGGDGGGPNDIRRREAPNGSNQDTSSLEFQLAKLLLANRGSGPQDDMGEALGLPSMAANKPSRNASPPKPGSTFSLSGVSTSELLQAIQKKTSGGGGGGGRGNGMPTMSKAMAAPSDAGGFNPSSRIPSEAAGLLAAIVASRVRS